MRNRKQQSHQLYKSKDHIDRLKTFREFGAEIPNTISHFVFNPSIAANGLSNGQLALLLLLVGASLIPMVTAYDAKNLPPATPIFLPGHNANWGCSGGGNCGGSVNKDDTIYTASHNIKDDSSNFRLEQRDGSAFQYHQAGNRPGDSDRIGVVHADNSGNKYSVFHAVQDRSTDVKYEHNSGFSASYHDRGDNPRDKDSMEVGIKKRF